MAKKAAIGTQATATIAAQTAAAMAFCVFRGKTHNIVREDGC